MPLNYTTTQCQFILVNKLQESDCIGPLFFEYAWGSVLFSVNVSDSSAVFCLSFPSYFCQHLMHVYLCISQNSSYEMHIQCAMCIRFYAAQHTLKCPAKRNQGSLDVMSMSRERFNNPLLMVFFLGKLLPTLLFGELEPSVPSVESSREGRHERS